MSYFLQHSNQKLYFSEHYTGGSGNTPKKLVIDKITKIGVTNWKAPQDTTVEYLIVGGGGAGGNAFDDGAGGGGGAGAVVTGKMDVTKDKNYKITVGSGGNISAIDTKVVKGGPGKGTVSYSSKGPGEKGGDSSIISDNINIVAQGGSGGEQSVNFGGTRDNGKGGAKADKNIGGGGGRMSINIVGGGGGGGNRLDGETVSSNKSGKGGKGGSGISSSISGKSTIYGSGGNGGNFKKAKVGANGASNTGNGGDGASSIIYDFTDDSTYVAEKGVKGGIGGSGIVILSYYVDDVKDSKKPFSLEEEVRSSAIVQEETRRPKVVVQEEVVRPKPVVQEEVYEIRKYKVFQGKDKAGADIGSPITGKSLEEVARLCKSTQGCVGFVRDVATNTFYLKSDFNNVFNNSKREIYLSTSASMKEYNPQTNYDVMENTRRYEFTIRNEEGKSVEECLMSCDTMDNCVGVVYTPDGKCNYKENILGASTGTPNETNFKLYKKKSSTLNDFVYIPGKDVYGGNIGQAITGKSIEEVARLCKSTQGCVGFVRNPSKNEYYLKNSFVNVYSMDPAQREIFALKSAEVIDIKTGYDVIGNTVKYGYDIRTDTGKGVDECAFNCNSMDNCTGFVYTPDGKCIYKESTLGASSGTPNEANFKLYKRKSSTLNNFTFIPGKDKFGADIGQPITGKQIDEVARICKGTSNCVGFVRDVTNGTCYLKSNFDGIYNVNPSQREIYMLNNAKSTDYNSTTNYDMSANTNRTGYDIGTDNGWPIEGCLAKCDNMDNCSGVAFTNNTCYYKENVVGSYGENNVNLYKKKNSPINDYSFVVGKDISQKDNRGFNKSNSIGFATNTNLPACSKLCNNTNGCIGFVWDVNSRSCDLKNNFSPTASDVPGKELYYKNSIVPQNYTYLPGVERSGDDIGKSMKGSPNDCKNRCDSLPDCRGIIYEPGASECWMKKDVVTKRSNNVARDLYIKK